MPSSFENLKREPYAWLARLLALRPKPARDLKTIIGPAVRYSELGVVALATPATHQDVMKQVEEQRGRRAGKHKGQLGFMTLGGDFVLPRKALIIAQFVGQVPKHGCSLDAELKCSDLVKQRTDGSYTDVSPIR